MKQSTATRRLVKSPPELWAELSSEDSLGRHLAEFGEIRITRVQPETTVAWEGDRASGTVELTPTGWGTKVMLTATPAKAPPDDPPAATASVAPVAPPEVEVAAGRGDTRAASTPPARTVEAPAAIDASADRALGRAREAPAATDDSAASTPDRIVLRPLPDRPAPQAAPEAPRGFFARLFRKRRPQPAPQTPPAPSASVPPAGSAPAPRAGSAPAPRAGSAPAPPAGSIPAPPVPVPDPAPPAPAPDPSPMPPPAPDPVPPTPAPQPPPPPQIKALDPERTVAILTEVLDDLGAAHHRPFSRD